MDGESSFLLGINYWPRRKAMYWWKSFDAGEADEELAQISDYGLRAVRLFLLWEDFQPRPDRIDPARLGDLVTVLDLAGKHGLMAMPTLLVGNMSGVMWFPLWAFTDEPQRGRQLQISNGRYVHRALRSPFTDPIMLRAEALLAASAAHAVAGHPALHSWDLANEIDQACQPADPADGWLWAFCLAHAIHDGDPSARVTYGAHDMSLTTDGLAIPALAPSLDYLAMHSYPIYSEIARGPLDPDLVPYVTALTAHLGNRACLMQEFGLPTTRQGEASHTIEDCFLGVEKPQFLTSEDDQAEYYERVLIRLWQAGAPGALPWIYADYAPELWDKPPLDRARRERTFGLFRADGSPKPAADVIKRFAADVASGALAERHGPHGSRRPGLEVDPAEYYRQPAQAYAETYQTYLKEIGETS